MDAVKIKLKKISWIKPVLVISLIGNIAITGLFFSGCRQSAPVRSNYETPECFSHADTEYRESFTDGSKGTTAITAKGCMDSHKEQRAENRLKKCMGAYTELGFQTKAECRYYLNQK